MKHSFWHLDLFGGLRAVRLNQPEALPIENFRTQKAASLLAFLAFYRQAHRREVLAEMFWPDAEPLKARNSLRVALSGLREQLEIKGQTDADVLIVKRESLAIAPTVSTDVAQFRSRLQDAHFEVEEEARLQKLESAVDLVKGPLLRGFYDDWISGEAARLEDEFLSALRQIITTYEKRNEYALALDAARRGTIAAPLREGVVRDLVRLGYLCGQEENVKSEFEAYRRRVDRVGGAPPVEWHEFLRRATKTASALQPVSSTGTSSPPPSSVVPGPPNSKVSAVRLPAPPPTPNWQPDPEAIKPVPRSLSSFIGRERDLEALSDLLESPATRLVTITGTGGAGKTRLAQEMAHLLTGSASNLDEEKSQDRRTFCSVIWLPLASLPSPRLLPGALLDAIGAPAYKEDVETIAAMLRQLCELSYIEEIVEKSSTPRRIAPRMLLLADNCEHLSRSAAFFIGDLLARVPLLTILATSRSALNLAGEHSYRLSSLDAVPESSIPNIFPGLISKSLFSAPSDAVRLFAERARQARPDFTLGVADISLASKICQRLDGLPLAIEIVAARVTQFSLEEIAAGLGVNAQDSTSAQPSLSNGGIEGEPSELLDSLSQGIVPDATELIRSLGLLDWSNPNMQAPTRHSSLRTAIEWSSEQLSPAVARFWAKLSVFKESFTLEAAIDVCEEPYASVYLQALRDVSLLTISLNSGPVPGEYASGIENTRETPRIIWLNALREFATDVLPVEERESLEARHAQYFLNWTLQLRSLLSNHISTREQRMLDAEAVNLRTALHWLLEHDLEGAMRMANALCWHWEQAGNLIEGRMAIETALERSRDQYASYEQILRDSAQTPDVSNESELRNIRERLRERAQAHEGAGKMANMVADHDAVSTHLAESLRLFQLLEDESGIASSLYAMGFNALRRGDLEKAQALCQQSLEITRRLGNTVLLSDALYNLTMVSLISADFPTVRQLSAERLVLCRANGDRRGLAISLENLGLAALFEGASEAEMYFSECLTAFEALEDKPSVARALWGLGQVALYSQRLDEARDRFMRSVSLMRETHNIWAIPYLLESFGALAVAKQQWQHAATLLGGAAGLRSRQGEPLLSPRHQNEFDQLCQQAQTALGEEAFNLYWQKGQTLERSQLLNLAQSSSQ